MGKARNSARSVSTVGDRQQQIPGLAFVRRSSAHAATA
jgi:hypothetical protein